MTGPAPDTGLRSALDAEAHALGFAAIAVTRPDAVTEAGARLGQWVAQDRHGEMGWMADRLAWRSDPSALWPEARAVNLLAESYAPETDPLAVLGHGDLAAFSVYAQGRDYHDVVK
jgi:epoxyqueuosine reductase